MIDLLFPLFILLSILTPGIILGIILGLIKALLLIVDQKALEIQCNGEKNMHIFVKILLFPVLLTANIVFYSLAAIITIIQLITKPFRKKKC